jgi:hypothetical protein
MGLSALAIDLAFLLAYTVGEALLFIGAGFLAGSFLYSMTVVTIFIIRNE